MANNVYQQFDGIKYFLDLCAKNKLCRDNGFKKARCSGLGNLEEVLQNFRTNSNIVAVEDATSEQTVTRGNAFFNQRVFTVFLIAGCKSDDMDSVTAAADLCKEIKRQFLTRMLKDKHKFGDKLIFMNTDIIKGQELGAMFLNGRTGLYFMVEVQEPVELIYNDSEWITETT